MLTTRSIYWINTNPGGWTVSRRISDFKWVCKKIASEFPIIGKLKIKDKSDVETFILMVNNNQLVSHHQFMQYFLSCTDYKSFYERRKNDSSSRKSSNERDDETSLKRSPQILPTDLKNFLDELTPKAKSIRSSLKDARRYLENLYFLLDQISERICKVASCFGKASDAWASIEKMPDASKILFDSTTPDLSSRYSTLKLTLFQWSAASDCRKQQVKKLPTLLTNFLDATKESSRSLNVRKETEGQGKVADDIAVSEVVRQINLERQDLDKWVDLLRLSTTADESMQEILRKAGGEPQTS